MLDIKEISEAWWNSYFATQEKKEIAKNRLEICQDCPSMTTVLQKMGKKLSVSLCGECGCPISKKIFSPKYNACPLKKWENVDSKYIDEFNKKSLI